MARTLELKYATGYSLSVEVVARGTNVITETITMTEKSVAKQVYTGTIATATAGTYELNLKASGEYIATDAVVISGTDGTTSRADSVAISNVSDDFAAGIWAYATRTLTQSAASVVSAVSGSDITVYRGTKWSISLTNIGALTNWTKLYFTVRKREEQADAQSQVQIKLTNPSAGTDGLIWLNAVSGASITAAHGSITVDDEPTGDITIALAAAASASCVTDEYYYDVKMITASNVTILTIGGKLTILPDITRAVS